MASRLPSNHCEINTPFSEFHFAPITKFHFAPVLPPKKLWNYLILSIISKFWKWNAKLCERLFMRRLYPPTSTYRVEYRVVTSWNVLVPSRLVNFPGKFITRRLVLSGIAWLRGITIESTKRGAAAGVLLFLSISPFLESSPLCSSAVS